MAFQGKARILNSTEHEQFLQFLSNTRHPVRNQAIYLLSVPKIGSSRGKIGRTRVTGVKRVLKDLLAMIKSIQALQKYDSKCWKDKGLDKFVKSIKTTASIKF